MEKDDAKLLQFLVETIDKSQSEGFGMSNTIVRVEDIDDDELELGTKDIDCHPVDALLGFTAPPSWRVLGVACGAFAGPLAPAGEPQVRPSGHPDAIRVRVIALTARSGIGVGQMRRPDGTVTDLGPGERLVADCLCRALGLPTPPPPGPPHHLIAVRWLEDVIAGHSGEVPEPLPPRADWDFIRRRFLNGEWNDEYNLTVDDAAWMDAGLLARWMFGEHPPLGWLLRALEPALGPAAATWALTEVERLLRT